MQFSLCISSTSAFLFNQIPDDKQGEEKELFYVVGRGAAIEALNAYYLLTFKTVSKLNQPN